MTSNRNKYRKAKVEDPVVTGSLFFPSSPASASRAYRVSAKRSFKGGQFPSPLGQQMVTDLKVFLEDLRGPELVA